jgi:FKBP-type peptidyl-prolyl cis-trans isomerase SlyD
MNEILNVVANDMVVTLDYTLTVDGEIVDSGSLDYLQGHNNIIPGLESRVLGMSQGEVKEVLVPAAEGYGEIDPEAFATVEKDKFPADFGFELGRELRVANAQGQVMLARISEINTDSVLLDLNHPMAGKDLLFFAKIASIRPANEEEIANGRLGGGCASCSSSGGCSSGCG